MNGKELSFQRGDTIIRSRVHDTGIDIPHYCWHPGLSIAANCRMCLVAHHERATDGSFPVLNWDEKKKGSLCQATKPKLQPACQIEVQPKTWRSAPRALKSDNALQAHKRRCKSFLLLNHPVDCPICDQAGECKLQDYWLDHAKQKLKRKRTEPVHKAQGRTFRPDDCVRRRALRHVHALHSFLRRGGRGPRCSICASAATRNEIVLSSGTRARQQVHAYDRARLSCRCTHKLGTFVSKRVFGSCKSSARTFCTGCATGCNTFTSISILATVKSCRLRPARQR